MKKILIIISCISILFCGCNKSENKKTEENTSTSTESGISQLYYIDIYDEAEEYDETEYGPWPGDLSKAINIVEDNELKSINIGYDKDNNVDYIAKRSYISGKVVNEKICDLSFDDRYNWLFSNVDNNIVALYEGSLINDVDVEVIELISLADNKIVDTVYLDDIYLKLLSDEKKGMYIENIQLQDNTIKIWMTNRTYSSSMKEYKCIVDYDISKQEVTGIVEYNENYIFGSSAGDYSIGVDITDRSKKWIVLDNNTCEIKQYLPDDIGIVGLEEDRITGRYWANEMLLDIKDGKYYVMDGYGIYNYDIENNEINKLSDYKIIEKYPNYILCSFEVISEKEFYCIVESSNDDTAHTEYEVLHIVL